MSSPDIAERIVRLVEEFVPVAAEQRRLLRAAVAEVLAEGEEDPDDAAPRITPEEVDALIADSADLSESADAVLAAEADHARRAAFLAELGLTYRRDDQ